MDSADSRDGEVPLVVDNLQPAQTLESTVNAAGDLGTISLGILYVSFSVFSLVASLVVRALGSKNALVLGTTGYWLFIAANLKPSWYTMVPGSLYLGFVASVIWVGAGTYLTFIARSHARGFNFYEGTVIGKFNGEFWGVYNANQVVGNLISLALLGDGEDGSTRGTILLFTVFLCSMTLGTTLICFLHQNDNRKEKGPADSSAISLSKSVIAPLLDKRMLLIIHLFAYTGLQTAFVWADFTKEIVKPALGQSGVGGAMAVLGAFDVICSVVAGRLTSGLKSITFILCGGLLVQAVVFLWLLLTYSITGGVLGIIYPLLTAGLLGVGDAVLHTQLSTLLALLFNHDTEGSFAHMRVRQSAAIAVIFFLSPHISFQTMVLIMLAGICVSLLTFLFLALKVEKAFSRIVNANISAT
ncbi:hypothetical protein SLEP1_g17754 [Rubroshorea leprosula]|uniref:UNC93-like protein 3 n=1 Tax=Rubroshorea leprosula TaxID=152421 RepID=A0AAV5J4A9_9ROSI|nr:hypothetical protein SLEP1_g17754 [Rubroshorea leprosula]